MAAAKPELRATEGKAASAHADPHDEGWSLFEAESSYAESIVLTAMGDAEGCVAALERSLEWLPTYAPALLSMGSVKYQLGRPTEGLQLFLSLLELPNDTPDLSLIIDEAGDFLIGSHAYADGLQLYRGAVARFPRVAAIQEGLSCCAGHEGMTAEAVAASRAALALEPENQEMVNNLGWSLYIAGELEEARQVLMRATEMDPLDDLAAGNLRVCDEELKRRGLGHGSSPA